MKDYQVANFISSFSSAKLALPVLSPPEFQFQLQDAYLFVAQSFNIKAFLTRKAPWQSLLSWKIISQCLGATEVQRAQLPDFNFGLAFQLFL